MKNDEPLTLEQIASFCATYEALKQMYIIPKKELAIKTTSMIENLCQYFSIKEE